jgi:NAD(P)-dependent dehydrogenase (short-subunit alcohol dehydrogenase family)
VADATDARGLEAAVAGAEAAGGPLDVLVAAAGITGPTAPLVELDPADWDATIRTNLTGVFLLCRAVMPGMLRRGSGSVVVVGSVTGKRPLLNRTAYAASKTGLIGLVRTLAHEVGPGGVRVNLVSPGPVAGERFDRVVRDQAHSRGVSEGDVRAEFSAPAALRRPVDPSEVAAAVAFLAGPASAGITGEDLNVAAGLVMHG